MTDAEPTHRMASPGISPGDAPVKVMHIEWGRHLYGGARQVAYLLNHLPGEAGTHHLVGGDGAAILAAVVNPAIHKHALPFAGDLDLASIQRLRELIRQTRPDLLHIHSRRGDWLCALAGWLERVPMVYSRRVDNPPNWLERHGKFPLFQRVITISAGIQAVLLEAGLDPAQIVCIPSAVDTHRYRPEGADRVRFRAEFGLREQALVVGMVAQLIPRKGHQVLFAALPEVLAHYPDVTVLLFGQGPLADSLAATINRNGWQERVRLAGFRPDMERLMPCLDVLVHPAAMEGLGVSLLEAASAGVPVIASRVGGIPEVVIPGLTGELIAPGDSQTLREHLLRFVGDPALRHACGSAGRTRVVECFSIDRMVRDNCRVYETVKQAAGTAQC